MRTADNHVGWCVEKHMGVVLGWVPISRAFHVEDGAKVELARIQEGDPANEYRTYEAVK